MMAGDNRVFRYKPLGCHIGNLNERFVVREIEDQFGYSIPFSACYGIPIEDQTRGLAI